MKRPVALLAAACLVSSLATVVPATSANAAGPMASAASLLAQLPVMAENTSSFNRDNFGYSSDFDANGDGCGTRKEVLKRDAVVLTSVSASCAVYGKWTSLYDNVTTTVHNDFEVDHLVALSEAWDSGAQLWTSQQRIAFGNDVGYKWDLQAVTKALNQDKVDKDPADWMPPQNRCTYIAAWIGVKYRWKLSVDTRELSVLNQYLAACPGLQVEQPGTPDVAALSGTPGGIAPGAPVTIPAPPVVVAPAPVVCPSGKLRGTVVNVYKEGKAKGKYVTVRVTGWLANNTTGRVKVPNRAPNVRLYKAGHKRVATVKTTWRNSGLQIFDRDRVLDAEDPGFSTGTIKIRAMTWKTIRYASLESVTPYAVRWYSSAVAQTCASPMLPTNSRIFAKVKH